MLHIELFKIDFVHLIHFNPKYFINPKLNLNYPSFFFRVVVDVVAGMISYSNSYRSSFKTPDSFSVTLLKGNSHPMHSHSSVSELETPAELPADYLDFCHLVKSSFRWIKVELYTKQLVYINFYTNKFCTE